MEQMTEQQAAQRSGELPAWVDARTCGPRRTVVAKLLVELSDSKGPAARREGWGTTHELRIDSASQVTVGPIDPIDPTDPIDPIGRVPSPPSPASKRSSSKGRLRSGS